MDTPTCDVSRGRFSKWLVTASHTHTGGVMCHLNINVFAQYWTKFQMGCPHYSQCAPKRWENGKTNAFKGWTKGKHCTDQWRCILLWKYVLFCVLPQTLILAVDSGMHQVDDILIISQITKIKLFKGSAIELSLSHPAFTIYLFHGNCQKQVHNL